ncbi:hypothetical protein [Novosphingobium mangrovi (ex Huang et al. 2023)]|uniref:Uncharacterized protein n=1 Tax=Novosphingobium mangrovi (ex Huang et al. 2023) TaxID=2976432 RepID=A0ABT2I1J7_9SPHN|nr:hypothetical protein [Novosphingobium mangrovi (ex Huang et al. 2023)]MCT2398518.1 hypothetical protein [Novosphingobium mangrovi (ex Huang et al. 2023)]
MAASQAEIAAALARLEAYQAAEMAVLRNQSYEMPDGRKLTRANLKDIQNGLALARADYQAAVGEPVVRGRARRFVNMSR